MNLSRHHLYFSMECVRIQLDCEMTMFRLLARLSAVSKSDFLESSQSSTKKFDIRPVRPTCQIVFPEQKVINNLFEDLSFAKYKVAKADRSSDNEKVRITSLS